MKKGLFSHIYVTSKQIDNFSIQVMVIRNLFIKLRVQGLQNPVKTASAKSDETIFLKYQVYEGAIIYGKKY